MKEIWQESQANVLDCRNEAPVLSALTFGLRPKKKFRVAYDFTVDGQLHTGEFPSAKAFAEGDLIPVRYSSTNPDQNNLNYQNVPAKTSIAPLILGLLFLLALIRFYFIHTSH
jgi:hypothetical protein